MAVALAALVSATACTDEASPPVSTAELTTTIVVQESTTTEASTTTTAPEPTAPPTSSQEEIEVELIATLDGINDLFAGGPDPDSPLIDQFYDAELADTVRGNFADRVAESAVYEGRFERLSIESIEIDGSTAQVLECGIDAVATISASGEVLVAADDVGFLRRYEMTLGDDGQWRVSLISFGLEKTPCEP